MMKENTKYYAQQEKGSPVASYIHKNNKTPATLLLWLLIALVYFLSAQLGLALAFEQANTSPVWLPTGIAIAALLHFGLRAWPGIFVGAYAANYLTGVSIPVATGIAFGNTLEGLVASYLIIRIAGRIPFGTILHVVRFAAIVLLAAAISASVGVTSLALGGNIEQPAFALLWSTWWLGDVVGALVITPLLLTWFPFSLSVWKTARPFEALFLFGGGILCSVFIFSDWLYINADNFPLSFLFLPFAIWAAVRFRQHGVTAILFMISVFAIYGTLKGFGPFVRASPNESLLLLQGFMGVLMITTLLLAASIDEKRKTTQELHKAKRLLERHVEHRTQELTHINHALESEITNRRHSVDALRSLLESTAYTGEKLFHTCVKDLAAIYDAKYAFISIFADDTKTTMRTLAFWSENHIMENFEYNLEGTPCQDVLRNKMGQVSANAAQQYPKSKMMNQLDVESYFGAELLSPSQALLGLVIVMDTKFMPPREWDEPILGIAASRLALEIERGKTEDELKLAASVFSESVEAIVITDRNGTILRVNPAFSRITGFDSEEVIGKNPRLLSSKQHYKGFYEALWQTLLKEGVWQGEIYDRRKNGELFPAWQTISTVRDKAGEIIQFISIFSDISEKKSSEERIYHLAHYDTITGLPNRIYFQDQLDLALAHGHRQNSTLALLFLDLDNFKVINDAFGHPAGDTLIKQVAHRLSEIVREDDIVARLGGDEFTILLSETHSSQDAALVAEKVLNSLAIPFKHENMDVVVSASIGISTFPTDGENTLTLLKNADSAMYQAKQKGRNNFQFFTAEMNTLVKERLRLEADMRKALELGEFILHYQPQLSLESGEIIGCEALVRWLHPSRGLISPYTFIPVAEESGLIVPLGAWIMRTALTQLQQWQQAGLPDITMSVNLSAQQFGRHNLMQAVQRILSETGVDPKYLELELTESMLMTNVNTTVETLHALRDMGVTLSIDDFGTGYSSMAYLKRFPIDKLKIDQSFVRDLEVDSEDAAIVTATIALGHSLNLTMIAEGVETEQQLDFLRAKGCEQIQGYYFSRPVLAEDFADQLQSGRNVFKDV